MISDASQDLTTETNPGANANRSLKQLLVYFPHIAIVLGIVLAFSISTNRVFQADEVETIHAAYNIATGKLIYRDFWQGHNPLLYLTLSPILPISNPVLAFQLSRLAMFILFGVTIFFSGWLTKRHGGNPWLTAALLLLHTTFVERGMEVRPDTLMTTFLMLALWVGTSERLSQLQRVSVQGALLGLAFITTQKAAIVCFALGCCWLVSAIHHRDWKLVILPCLVWAMPFAAMLAVFKLVGGYDEYVLYNLLHPLQSISGSSGAPDLGVSPISVIIKEWKRNVPFLLAALFGIAMSSWMAWRRDFRLLPTAAVAALWVAGLFIMAFPYPYSHVGGLPALAVLIGVAVPTGLKTLNRGHGESSPRQAVVIIVLICAVMIISLPRLIRELGRTNSYQFHLLERVQVLTEPGDRVFDLAGLYFREDAYPVYLMTGAHYWRYRQGDYPPIAPWLREHGVSLFILNYRITWLEGEDRRFLQSHFVRVEPNIWMSGSFLANFPAGGVKSFEVTRESKYRFDGEGELLVDGQPFTQGLLAKGIHTLSSPTGIDRGRVVLARAPAEPTNITRDFRVFFPFD